MGSNGHSHELDAPADRHPRGKINEASATGADDAQHPFGMLGCLKFSGGREFFDYRPVRRRRGSASRAGVVDHLLDVGGGQVLVDVPLSPHKRRKSGHFLAAASCQKLP
jgi:hypothetical protein